MYMYVGLTWNTGLCCCTVRVKMACERDDCAFMLVLPTLRDRAPRLREVSVWMSSEREREEREGERERECIKNK